MSSDPTGPQEIEDHVNFIERLIGNATATDEYLEAIIRNQTVMIGLMEDGGANVPEIGSVGTPQDTAGIVIQGASEGDLAEFLYKDNGRTIVKKFETSSDIRQGEVAVLNSVGEVEPKSGVRQGDLDFGNIATQSGNASDFVYGDTPEDVTIEPGDTETVLSVSVNGGGSLQSIGTNDETFSLYQYNVDGESILPEPLPKPLGLYNSMFEFPVPLSVGERLEVEVTRQEDAPAPQSYYSNAVIMK